MATDIKELCKVLGGFVMKNREDGNDIFKAIKFEGQYAYASDTRIAVRVLTKGVDTTEALMRTTTGLINDELDPGDYPDFNALLNNKRLKEHDATKIVGLNENRTTFKWAKAMNFIKASLTSLVKAVVLEKRGRELIVFSRNGAVEMKTILSNSLVGGEDITLVVNANYLSAMLNIIDYLGCDRCDITFTGRITSMQINGYKGDELLCTVIIAPINANGTLYEKLIAFRDRDAAVNTPARIEPEKPADADDELGSEDDWDFLGEE